MLCVEPGIRIPLGEFRFTYVRSAGPGGQNVNKVNSKAVLRWPVSTSPSLPDPVRARFLARYANRITTDGDLVLSSQRYRDQPQNRDDCLEKLQAMLTAIARPPVKRRKTRPSRGSIERRLTEKRQKSRHKHNRSLPADD